MFEIAESIDLPRNVLLVVVHPSGEVWVSIRIFIQVDVGLGREARWVAADVFLSLRLVHAYVVNLEVHREREVG